MFLTSAISHGNDIEIGNNAPEIETTEGINVVADANSNEKSKVISFWSPKQPSSRISNRNLSALYGQNDSDYEFISICTDGDEDLMKEVMKIDGINPARNLAYSAVSPRVFKDYGVENQPRAFVISPEGKITDIL